MSQQVFNWLKVMSTERDFASFHPMANQKTSNQNCCFFLPSSPHARPLGSPRESDGLSRPPAGEWREWHGAARRSDIGNLNALSFTVHNVGGH